MDYRLLGPLEALAGDRDVPLGGPKQRAVLTVLLLRAGETVSTDTLIDEVWGERPPVSVTATLHNCVFRLRKALGAETIERRAPGYVLHARDDEIDARRFERALAAAGARPPLPISRSSPSPRPRPPGSRSCGWSRSRSGSTPSSRSAARSSSSPSSSG